MPTYLQLVHQVEHALRLGYLKPGDQLPKVRDVVASLAINPNTVLKAYKELETKGLAAGRPGQGTFVQATLSQVALPELTVLRRSLSAGSTSADAAGLDEDGIVALFTSALRDFYERQARPPRAGAARAKGKVSHERPGDQRPGQALPRYLGATRVHAGDPRRAPSRAGRAERRGQDHPDEHDGRTGRADHRDHHRAPGRRRVAAALDGVAFVAQDAPVYRNLTVYKASVFDSRPVAFAAWTLAAFTISAFLGMLFRRIIPAMAVTLGVYLGLALLVWDVRKFYPLSLVSSNPSIGSGRITPGDPWVVSQWFTGHGGQPVSQSVVNRVVAHSQIGPRQLARVLTEHGYTAWTRYIPVSRFWPVQLGVKGRLAARPLGPARRRHRLARPPPRRLKPPRPRSRGPRISTTCPCCHSADRRDRRDVATYR